MRCSFLILFTATIILSCSEQTEHISQPIDSEAEDFSAYQIEDLGNGISRAIKRSAAGGLMEKGYIFEGKRNGVWTKYNQSGKPAEMTSYVNGKSYGPDINFNNLVQVDNWIEMADNQLHGSSVTYRRGRRMQRLNYDFDVLDGIQEFYFESGMEQGKIRQRVTYDNGVIHGKMYYYDEQGKVTVEYDYENGERKSGGIKE